MGSIMIGNQIFRFGLGCALTVAQALHAENWPEWRGPRGDGTSLEKRVPVSVQASTNLIWKTPIPGEGHSSPVIWNDRCFMLSADTTSTDRLLIALDTKSGQVVWNKTILKSPLE